MPRIKLSECAIRQKESPEFISFTVTEPEGRDSVTFKWLKINLVIAPVITSSGLAQMNVRLAIADDLDLYEPDLTDEEIYNALVGEVEQRGKSTAAPPPLP